MPVDDSTSAGNHDDDDTTLIIVLAVSVTVIIATILLIMIIVTVYQIKKRGSTVSINVYVRLLSYCILQGGKVLQFSWIDW